MECPDVRRLADAYLSEQLLVETNQAIVHHLERCPACRAEFEGQRRLRAFTRSAFEQAPGLQPRPEYLREMRARVKASGDTTVAAAWRPWLAAAASVLVAVGLSVATLGWLSRADLLALAHLAAGDHQNCALKFALPERPITLDEAARKFDPAFGALQTVVLPAPTGARADVLERHACIYDGQLFAHLVITYQGHAVSVLVADATASAGGWRYGASATALPATRGFNLASFRGAGHSVFVVSTLPLADVQEVAQAIATPILAALGGA